MQHFWWNHRRASQGSRALSKSGSKESKIGSKGSRGSHSVRGSQPKELEFQFFIRQTETLYPPWWTRAGAIDWFQGLPDDTLWNCYICGSVLLGLVLTVANLEGIYIEIVDVIYNISYAIHVFATGYKMHSELENTDLTFFIVVGFLLDILTFAHYVQSHNPNFKLGAYYVRLHRPFKYLWSLNDYNLKGSILGTTLKYCYIFMVMRITWAYVWLHVRLLPPDYYLSEVTGSPDDDKGSVLLGALKPLSDNPAGEFLAAVYNISKMFIPIGPSGYPCNDVQRVVGILIMMSGCLVVTGAAVASLSLIISLYMRPEETFRSRYRLIMKEMSDTRVPPALREKVETFYKMYWHKQRAVSKTQLLPTFPPTLPATINLDIYFEATQKARILRELSHQLLSELAKKMETIHYIPGDAIIKRGSKKCKIIYITYGDVEMLTAEDDNTAILRMTRGTVLTPCGGAVSAALGLSHVAVRAATFCTAHVLKATELWRVVHKHSVSQDHAGPILASFTDHVERVKRHYYTKVPDAAIHKSSILQFNRNLKALKSMKDANGVLLLASPDIFLEIAGCYIMRNRPDATLTDQADEICLRPKFPCILQPNSSLLFAWNAFIAFLILMCCFIHPYNLVFEKEASMEFRFFDQAVTVAFIIDHITYLSTGANVEEGVPITFTQTSSQQMRSHWFVLDVVATLPVFEFIGEGHFAGINKLLRLPKLFRVLKSIEESCVYRGNVLRFLSYTLLLLIACYLVAAMQQGFMCYQAGYCLVTNFTHSPFWEQKPLDIETISSRLTFGLYWAISMINFTNHRQTWGYDDWHHVIYTLLVLEMCIVLRIFMEAVYSATIMVTTALREDYGSRIAMVKSFLIRNEVDPLLMKRFITYLQLCWHTDKAYKMTHKKHSNIFYDLPEHVFQDIVGRNRSKYILVIPFMKLVKKEDLKRVTSAVKLFYTSPNEILMNTGELTNEIYVIKRGICEILDPVTKEAIGHLTTKNHFGALICLLRLPAYYTIRAVTHVQVMCIPRKALQQALNTPQILQAINYLKTTPEFQRLQTPIPAFMKYEPPPPTSNLMHFRLPRKHEPDSEFLNPFARMGFLSILRYVFPRYTIRPDGRYMVRYEWFRFTCALCSMQLFPHYTYLVLQWPYLYYVAWFLDLAAMFDMFQRMLIGYFNEDGILVYHPSSTSSYYMKGGFIVDLFGCLPLENLEAHRLEIYDNNYRVTPTKQFLMLNRLLQMYRMPGAMMVLKDYIERRDILLVMQAIPLFMAVLNILTTFMVFYSVKIYYSKLKDGRYDWRIEPFNDQGGSWLDLFANEFRFNMTETPWNLHLATYFWVVYECSTTGYGVFNPSNQDLMKVLFAGMACSAMIITYYSVRIISIRANVNKSLAGFQQHMKDINVYMVREKLDADLQKEIRRYYEYNWEKMGGIDYRGVLKLCDQITLRTDAILHIYGPTFAKCPLLANADVSLLRIIGRAVRSVYFLRDMKIIEHDDMVTDMYFVDYGGVEVRVATGEMNSILRLPRGSVFGNLEGTKSHRSPYNVVATSRLHLLMIKSLAFSNVTKDFPAVKELMAKSRAPDPKSKDKEMKMYILGSEATVKMRRNVPTGPPPRNKTSILKYIYFQEGMVQIYLLSVCMGCIYLDLYNAGYQDNSWWLLITLYSLDFCFLLKIFTQHAFPFLVTSKSMKRIMMPLRRLYFKREFRYDLISMLPLELFSLAVKDVEVEWMWFGLLRLNRTFRIATVYKCLRMRNESITVNLTLTTVMAVFIWFTLFVHTTTCIWYFMAVIEDQMEHNSSWIHIDDGSSHCDNHYVCSLYFVITTFTQNGVGDIMPKKQSEVMFVAILQILSTMVFMVYVGEFSNIIQYQSYRSFSFYSKYLELQEFMKNNRVSQNLVTIVNKYTLHLWRENRGLQIPHFLKQAPLSLRLRVMSATYLHHITRHHIFEECEPAFLRQMVGCLKLYTYNEGMYVVKESEITDAMYVIHTGKVKETCEEMDISARVYPAGSYFGILQGLLRNTPYTHSYQTMIKSQVLTLKLDDWEYLLKHFPDSKDAIHKHMRQLGDKDMDQSNWPGGAPTKKKSAFELISEAPPEPSHEAGMSQFPSTERHFGRVSTQEETYVASGRRRSRYFAWPTDSREPDTPQLPRREEQEEERGVDQITVEEKPKQGFFGRFVSTAKKLMGRVSDPEALSSAIDGRDELLLEEDAEATEALLKQFEKAKKQEKDDKKLKSRRKSIFLGEEEDTEKHMLTLDMNESTTDYLEKKGSERFMMRPLRIRDDDGSPSTDKLETREVLGLGLHKSKVEAEMSEVQLTIEMLDGVTNREITETPEAAPETALPKPFLITEIPQAAADAQHAPDIPDALHDTQDIQNIQRSSLNDKAEQNIISPKLSPETESTRDTRAPSEVLHSRPAEDTTDIQVPQEATPKPRMPLRLSNLSSISVISTVNVPLGDTSMYEPEADVPVVPITTLLPPPTASGHDLIVHSEDTYNPLALAVRKSAVASSVETTAVGETIKVPSNVVHSITPTISPTISLTHPANKIITDKTRPSIQPLKLMKSETESQAKRTSERPLDVPTSVILSSQTTLKSSSSSEDALATRGKSEMVSTITMELLSDEQSLIIKPAKAAEKSSPAQESEKKATLPSKILSRVKSHTVTSNMSEMLPGVHMLATPATEVPKKSSPDPDTEEKGPLPLRLVSRMKSHTIIPDVNTSATPAAEVAEKSSPDQDAEEKGPLPSRLVSRMKSYTVIPDFIPDTSAAPADKAAEKLSPEQDPGKTTAQPPESAAYPKPEPVDTRQAKPAPDISPAATADHAAKKSSVNRDESETAPQSSKLESDEKPNAKENKTSSEALEPSGGSSVASDTGVKSAFAIGAARKASFAKKPIIFDPSRQMFGEIDAPILLPTDDDGNMSARASAVREESTITKSNRRFVHVRYDEGRSVDETAADDEEEVAAEDRPRNPVLDVTLDSDETVDKSTGESIESDEEDSATSTSRSSGSHSKPTQYRRTSGD